MKPYYQQDGITIYHGDCREVLPELQLFDLCLTDPPYGISYSPSGGGKGAFGKPVFKRFTGRDVVAGDGEPFQPAPLLGIAKNHILWGANHYASRLPDKDNWLVWDKREAESTLKFADCEMAWTDLPGQARIFRHMWNGVAKASESGESRQHPTQKPVALMRWCIRQAGNPWSAVDPYMGSGTALVAAKDAGLVAVGIELEERYCEIAAKRLSQQVLAFD